MPDIITPAAYDRLTAGERVDLEPYPLHVLARVIRRDWGAKMYFGAEPYLSAMLTLDSIDDAYGADRGRDVVAYFLSNASSWRGPVARAVKAELKRRLGR